MYEPRSMLSLNTEFSGTLISDFQPLKLRNKWLLFITATQLMVFRYSPWNGLTLTMLFTIAHPTLPHSSPHTKFPLSLPTFSSFYCPCHLPSTHLHCTSVMFSVPNMNVHLIFTVFFIDAFYMPRKAIAYGRYSLTGAEQTHYMVTYF